MDNLNYARCANSINPDLQARAYSLVDPGQCRGTLLKLAGAFLWAQPLLPQTTTLPSTSKRTLWT